jgi:hypothetical protein
VRTVAYVILSLAVIWLVARVPRSVFELLLDAVAVVILAFFVLGFLGVIP